MPPESHAQPRSPDPEGDTTGECVLTRDDTTCPQEDDLVWEDWCVWCQHNEEPPGAGADPYGRTAEDWAHHAE